MSLAPQALQQQLLQLGRALGEDGVPPQRQLSQLTYLLVLRMAQLPPYRPALPEQCDWQELVAEISRSGIEALNLVLIRMRGHAAPLVAQVFDAAHSARCQPATLLAVMRAIEGMDWQGSRHDRLGIAYTGLLDDYAALPRSALAPLHSAPAHRAALLAMAQPTREDVIVDPAAGLGLLLTAAAQVLREDPPQWPSALAGQNYGLIQRRDCGPLACANLLLNGLVALNGIPPLRHADPANPGMLDLFPPASLVLSDLASQRLPLRQELNLLRAIIGRVHARCRAVLRVSADVAGAGMSARRLRAQFPRHGVLAEFSATMDGSLWLQLRAGPQARPTPEAVPSASEFVLLGELVTECRHGLATARQVQGEGLAMLRASGVGPGYIREQDRCSVRAPGDCSAGKLALGDLLFVRNGPRRRVGICALVQSAATGLLFPDKLIRIRVDTRRVLPEWIAACVNDAQMRSALEAVAIPSTGQYRITRKQLLGLRIRLPSLAEQKRLLAGHEPLSPTQAYTAR